MDTAWQNNRELAEAFGVRPELLPYVPELLADVRALGSWPETIVSLLRPLALPQSTTALDLGCGKGAVSVAFARTLGFRVWGVDFFPPFIDDARVYAKERGVADLCQFAVGDIRETVKEAGQFDVVLFASVGSVFGDFSRMADELRRTVHPGGYMVIDDLYLAQATKLDRPGYEQYRSHDETIRQLTGHGDTLVQEVIIPIEDLRTFNRKTTESIRERARTLASGHPEIAEALARYVQWEETECRVLENETVPAVWLLQRA